MSLYLPTKDCVCALPMTDAYHDATNVRTLDASGNGQHFTFGDGATSSTYPLKIANRKGYNITSSTRRFALASPSYSRSTLSLFVAFRLDGSRYGIQSTVASHRDGTPTVGFHLDYSTTAIRWFTGGSAAANIASWTFNRSVFDRLVTLVGVYDGATKLFINGAYAASAATPLAPAAGVTEPLFLARYYAGTLSFTSGSFYSFRIYNRALSPLEIQGMHYEVRRKVSEI